MAYIKGFAMANHLTLLKYKSLEPPQFILLVFQFSFKSVAQCRFYNIKIIVIFLCHLSCPLIDTHTVWLLATYKAYIKEFLKLIL